MSALPPKAEIQRREYESKGLQVVICGPEGFDIFVPIFAVLLQIDATPRE